MNSFLPDSNYEWVEQGGKYYYTYDSNMIGFFGSEKLVTIKYYCYILSGDFMIFITGLLAYHNIRKKLIRTLMVITCAFFAYHAFEWVIWANEVNYAWHVIFITIGFMVLALSHWGNGSR